MIGCIKRTIDNGNERFVHFARDPDSFNVWIIDDKVNNCNQAPIDMMRMDGQIIMLFYNNIDNLPNNKSQ